MTHPLSLISHTPDETRHIGRALGKVLPASARLALIGPLGAGKTCFIQGLAEGLGCEEQAHSPSYVIIHEYRGRGRLYHCDWYRLETDGDVESTGFEDLLREDAVVAVEWADKHPGWLEPPIVEIRFEILDNDRRQIRRIGLSIIGEDKDIEPFAAALNKLRNLKVELQTQPEG
ncbi:MAG: tRNA (adenosine(37)-N6)-threonylcarbamoyltransferase complex ATPase subunit type 1 TsaE [Candidatus Sumerlaeota bacterium]|nr:tRNA (adenosine(37)-N6)-threonylcarbamoyltransferase complex ATPase subunit type 1 TsaE [Candidatus Sumerlaeota bacterium]